MSSEEETERHFEALLEYLKGNRGFDFTGYKRPSLQRRISKRMDELGLESYVDYLDYLEVHPEEFSTLFNTILINVTGFFRDGQAWDYLREDIIPRMLDRIGPKGPIRVWSAGCASGEEPYTMAILLAEAIGEKDFRNRVKIYATDVDEDALGRARHAAYGPKELEHIAPELREKYFETLQGRQIFRTDLRRSVVFGRHDLVQDAPISRMDLVLCRNTLMYFNAETQRRIIARFHFALNNGGFLFLGRAEMLLLHTNLFMPMDLKHRVFSKVKKDKPQDRFLEMAEVTKLEGPPHGVQTVRLREAAFNASPLAQIVVDQKGFVAIVSDQARALFNLSNHDLGRSLKDLEVSFRPVELRAPLEKVFTERTPTIIRDAERAVAPDVFQYFDVLITPIFANGDKTPTGASITFTDVSLYHRLQEDIDRVTQDRETANEELQSANEELETTNEELQSTVEELQTTNEELQSTNEEMETMNEELQSTNEELRTASDEQRLIGAERDQINAFLESVLSSLRAGVVVVDEHLRIHLWNAQAEEMWGLQAREVQGKPLQNLDIGLPIEEMEEPIRRFLTPNAGPFEPITVEAVNRRGKRIRCAISCTMRVGTAGESKGAVILMEEVEQ